MEFLLSRSCVSTTVQKHHMDDDKVYEEKNSVGSEQECYKLHRTNPGSSTSRNSSCTVTYLLSLKPSQGY